MVALILSSPVQSAEKIYLKWNNFGTEKEFITTTANRSLEVEKNRRDAEDYLAVAWVDLNGDGIPELIIGHSTIGYCSRTECFADIYTRQGGKPDGPWRFIGEISLLTLADRNIGPLFVTLEDEYHNGWRVIRGDGSRRCWVTEMRHANGLTKPEQLPGYFGFAEDGESCRK